MNYDETVEALSVAEDDLVRHLLSSVAGETTPGDSIRAGLVAFGLYDSVDMPYSDTDYLDDYKLIDSLSHLAEWFPQAPLDRTAELVSRYMGYVLLEFSLGQNIACDSTWIEVSVALSTIFRRKIEYQYDVMGLSGEEEGEEDEEIAEEGEEEEAAPTGDVQTIVDGKTV